MNLVINFSFQLNELSILARKAFKIRGICLINLLLKNPGRKNSNNQTLVYFFC